MVEAQSSFGTKRTTAPKVFIGSGLKFIVDHPDFKLKR